ncbi:MAG: ABC transporter permease [Lachnospiraceae bacterium]|nr:ABC transporter permease [Lachnospiraceae bacterium]MBQ7601801.1 ABC transporter permease [Lachnospiraceae bacterium]
MREPLFHIVRRNSSSRMRGWAVRGIAILAAVLLSGLLTFLVTGLNPLEVYSKMIQGNFGSTRRIWVLLQNTAILLIIALALTPAFKMRFWNTGAEGQVLIGGFGAALMMRFVGASLPNALLIPLELLAAVAAGALWGFIPAFFKAKWKTNETLFTLMMNYVAIQIVSWFCTLFAVPKGSGQLGILNQSTEAGWLPTLFGQKYMMNVIIVVLVLIFVFIYLRFSKHGYEISVVGESEKTARYVGINVKSVIIRTMLLSGALCGVAGFLLVCGTDHSITPNTVGGEGFTGIMVSWLAKFNPFVMVFTSALIIFMKNGAAQIATSFHLNESFGDILTGIIIFFIIGCEFFINYRVVFRKKAAKEKDAPVKESTLQDKASIKTEAVNDKPKEEAEEDKKPLSEEEKKEVKA